MNRSVFYTWLLYKTELTSQALIINFGPQHPAAHGVLRLVLQLRGELVQRLDTHIGLLHRGTEFLAETKFYEKNLPYFDRLDYVSMMTQEHAYCLAIESLLGVNNVFLTVNYTRILFDELTRILNHMLAISCHALDVGSMSSVFWSFEEREKLMEFYERVSGARMHAAFHRPALTFEFNIDKVLLIDILYFIKNCFVTLNEMHNVLTYNKIWKQRLTSIGVLSVEDCQVYNLTGIIARSCGIKRDVRLSMRESYSSYSKLNLRSYIGVNGDTYDRYLLRMLEMGESLSLINLVLPQLLCLSNNNNVLKASVNFLHNRIFNFSKVKKQYTSMEDLINHFVNWHSGIFIKKGITSIYIESPKGEFGVSLVSNNSNKPARCKVRSPSYHNLQFLSKLSKGHYLADLTAIIGTIDIVFGEIDR